MRDQFSIHHRENMSHSASVTLAAVFLAAALFLAGALPALGTTDYAAETGQKCSVCHISASGGGGLTAAGESYSEDPGNWSPPPGSGKRIPLFLRIIHVVILYAHVFFGVIWIGTILYVHLVLKPKYALGGLPRSELRLAWLSMPLLAITGVLLTLWRLRLAPGLFSTLFGRLLLVKIGIFVLMVSSATFVTLFVGPRLKALVARQRSSGGADERGSFTPEQLKSHDGSQGSRALVAAEGKVYDVSGSRLWKGGVHAGRHKAGQDLTEFLSDAPHDSSVLARFEKVGDLTAGVPARVPGVIRVFTVNAYFNLVGCFLIILVLVLWRW